MDWVIVVQIVLAALLGAVLGIEREIGAQPAGLRTHMLVAVGAAVFTLAGVTDVFGADPTRVAAQVVTGIGFLGGGAIFKEGVNIRGLTTASSLWVTAAIGLAVGLRQWLAAIAATVLAMIVLWVVRLAEHDWLPRRHNLEVILFLAADAALDEVERQALAILPKAAVNRIDYAGHDQSIVLSAKAQSGTSLPGLAEQLRHLDGVAGVEVAR
jgi:putative Mg2+ transporter-C (MgtC) family protein